MQNNNWYYSHMYTVLQVDSLVGYSIGEVNAPLTDTNEAVLPNNCYEVVLGWVNPK